MKPAGNIPAFMWEKDNMIVTLFKENKDFRVISFLLLNGLVALGSYYLAKDPMISMVMGGAVNYVAYRVSQELLKEGIQN